MNKVFSINLYSSEELHAFCGHFISAFYIVIKFFSKKKSIASGGYKDILELDWGGGCITLSVY